MYCRGNKLLDYGISTATSSNPRRRNKVKRRKAYYSRQRRTDIAVSLIKIFKFFAHKYFGWLSTKKSSFYFNQNLRIIHLSMQYRHVKGCEGATLPFSELETKLNYNLSDEKMLMLISNNKKPVNQVRISIQDIK